MSEIKTTTVNLAGLASSETASWLFPTSADGPNRAALVVFQAEDSEDLPSTCSIGGNEGQVITFESDSTNMFFFTDQDIPEGFTSISRNSGSDVISCQVISMSSVVQDSPPAVKRAAGSDRSVAFVSDGPIGTLNTLIIRTIDLLDASSISVSLGDEQTSSFEGVAGSSKSFYSWSITSADLTAEIAGGDAYLGHTSYLVQSLESVENEIPEYSTPSFTMTGNTDLQATL